MKTARLRYLALVLLIAIPSMLGAGCYPPMTEAPAVEAPAVEAPPEEAPPAPEEATPIDPAWTPPPSNSDTPQLNDYTAVVALVKPSVVAIRTESGAGSGWIVSADGFIVTNSHVVAGAETVTITTDDDATYPAETVRTDPFTDLAVVKIDAAGLPAAHIGNSDLLAIGQQVAAIGNPLGLGISMKGGWVSRLGVSIPAEAGQTLSDLIETDAAINPGNSGGPLVNMAGEVIGITSAKIAVVDVEGMGYAISTNKAMPIINQLIQNGYVTRPYLGVSLMDVNPAIVYWYQLTAQSGAFISHVAPDSPAERAGLQAEDVITAFNGEEIAGVDDLIQAIHASQIGQRVDIVFWRGDEENTTQATLAENLSGRQ